MAPRWSLADIRDQGANRVLIAGGHVLIDGTLRRADVLIADGLVESVGELEPVADVPRVDATGRLVLPGLINAHTHAHNNLSRSSGDKWTLEQLRTRGAALYGGRTPEDHYVSAALGAIEMLRTGCTAAYDQFAAIPALTPEGIEAVVTAYTDVGLRAVVAPSFSDRPFYDVIPGLRELLPDEISAQLPARGPGAADDLLELCEGAIERWHGSAGGRIKVGLAPVIPGLCSDELLRGCARLAREHGVSIHTHLAESKVQAVSAFRRWGVSIVEHLDQLGFLSPALIAGHAVWIGADDIERLAANGCKVAHNPASNLRLGNGLAPVAELRARGVTAGIGSDGVHASDNQNMFEAMRIAALASRQRFPYAPERWLGSREVWGMATYAGAALIGEDGRVGAIQPGRRADLVLVRAQSSFLVPGNDTLNLLVYSETGADVTDVLVAGRPVLADGRVLGIDERALLARAEEAAERARARNARAWQLAEQLDPYLHTACGQAASEDIGIDRYGPIQPEKEEVNA